MTTSLYRKYDEQRENARRLVKQLKRQSMWCLSKVIKPESPKIKADCQLALAKAALAQALMADAVKRPGYLETADVQAQHALDFYMSYADDLKDKEVADCLATLAFGKILQGSLFSAEQELRTALDRLRTNASACRGELRDNLLSALGALAQAYIRDGQFDRALRLFELM